MKSVLIVGINGTVGAALKNTLEKNYTIFGTSSRKENTNEHLLYVDFCDSSTISGIDKEIAFDHVIITAGKEPQNNLNGTSFDHATSMFNIHVIGPMLLLKHLANKINTGGSITFISSPAAYKGSYDPSYAAVKGAVNALVRTFAKDFAPNVRVNAIAPGLIIDSPVFNRMTDDFMKVHINNSLTKKLTTAQQCADGIKFLMESEQITGQILHINGGLIYGY